MSDDISAADIEAVARMFDARIAKAVKRGSGVMLSWDDANGTALLLHAIAGKLSRIPSPDGERATDEESR